jgi:hypothetical protein
MGPVTMSRRNTGGETSHRLDQPGGNNAKHLLELKR